MSTNLSDSPASGSNVRQDFLASVVVFLVALPLCMGIAIASGVPVSAGLITGIVGGLVAGTLAGCPLQVSGPAAGLTVIVYQAVQTHGLDMLGVIVLLAGIFQFLAGVVQVGTWFRAVSPAVVRGMLAGIGVLILASQFHVMFDKQPESSGIKNLLAIPRTVKESLESTSLPPTADRGPKKQQIAEMRTLQRRQQVLKASVLDRITANKGSAVNFADLADEQAQISVDFDKADSALASAYQGQATRVETLHGLVASAVQATQGAAEQLRLNDPDAATEALTRAGQAADAVFGGVKNNHLAALIGVVTILAMVFWKGLAPKSLQLIPPALIAVLVGTGLALTLVLPVMYVDVPESMIDEIRFPKWAGLATAPWNELIPSALLMAVVASAETLLCCTAVDQSQNGPRTRYNKELMAQGIGNTICGLLGALPMTGVIVRSTANIQAGGQTRLSAMLHGAWLLVFVVFLSGLLRMIPTSCLAAILVYTGYKLIDIKTIKVLKGFGWSEVGIYFATVLVIVCKDLLSGVMVGFALAIAKLLYTFSRLEIRSTPTADGQGLTMDLHGAATFIRLPQFAKAFESIPRGTNLHVNLEHLDYIDHACLDLLMTWSKQHQSMGGSLTIDWDSLHALVRQEPAGQPSLTSRGS